MAIFVKRKYCDRLCMAQGMLVDNPSRQTCYHRARKWRKPACERCGSTKKLHVHHKDHDYKNGDPDNLETICEACHGKEHGIIRGNTFAGRQWLLKTDLGEIWAACRSAMEKLRADHPKLAKQLQDILHKQGQL